MKNRPVSLFAVAPPGLEDCCRAELDALGLKPDPIQPGGVPFVGGLAELYRANLHLRTAGRVLVGLGEFVARDFPTLFQRTLRLPWGSFLRSAEGLQVRVTVRRSRLLHSGRIADAVAAAVSQSLGEGARAGEGCDQLLMVRIEDDVCRFSVDSSGALLHRRGYRQVPTAAPLRENLAAGLLALLQWTSVEPLVDPFCGSGTLAIEAALLAAGIAPGLHRSFTFMHWPGFRQGLWRKLCQDAEREVRVPPELTLLASDQDADAVAAASVNAAAAGVADLIRIESVGLSELPLPVRPGLLLGNPPYGRRLEDEALARLPLDQLQRRLEGDLRGWRAGLIMPQDPSGEGWAPIANLKNGGLPVRVWRWGGVPVGKRA